jgi:hypothetical protein
VKRKALITLILGTTLAIAPAARAMVMMPDTGGGEGTSHAVVLNTDVLGGNGTVQPGVVRDGWLSSVTPSFTLRPDILGGSGNATSGATVATGGNSFNWGTTVPAAFLGALLLAAASVAITRRRRYSLSF